MPEDMLQMCKLVVLLLCPAKSLFAVSFPEYDLHLAGQGDSHQGQLRSLQMFLEVELGRRMLVRSLFTLWQRSPRAHLSSCKAAGQLWEVGTGDLRI